VKTLGLRARNGRNPKYFTKLFIRWFCLFSFDDINGERNGSGWFFIRII